MICSATDVAYQGCTIPIDRWVTRPCPEQLVAEMERWGLVVKASSFGGWEVEIPVCLNHSGMRGWNPEVTPEGIAFRHLDGTPPA